MATIPVTTTASPPRSRRRSSTKISTTRLASASAAAIAMAQVGRSPLTASRVGIVDPSIKGTTARRAGA